MFKHILVPTDGSQLSQDAVRRAVSFAKEAEAHITAFYAKPEHPVSHYAEGLRFELPPSNLDEFADKQAKTILAAVEHLCQEVGVGCTTVTRTTNVVYKAIIEVATENHCDLIFMASHGRRGIDALLLGSETAKVLTHSKIPVLVYR